MKPDWRDQRNCDEKTADTFFAARGRMSRDVLTPCQGCAVKEECLTFAVDSPWSPYGVWGGLPPGEVRALWRIRHPGNQRAEIEEAIGFRRDRSIR
jgi:Transcription factor WhiB